MLYHNQDVFILEIKADLASFSDSVKDFVTSG